VNVSTHRLLDHASPGLRVIHQTKTKRTGLGQARGVLLPGYRFVGMAGITDLVGRAELGEGEEVAPLVREVRHVVRAVRRHRLQFAGFGATKRCFVGL
jgi:hypothetical protein